MEVILLRHAQAVSKDINADQPLSDEGIKNIQKVAEFLRQSGWKCNKIRHSKKLRAEQTAGHLHEITYQGAKIEKIDGLDPNDPVYPMAKKLEEDDDNLILVGHLPFMAKLAGLLINQDENQTPVSFQPAGGACLVKEEHLWRIKWKIGPELQP